MWYSRWGVVYLMISTSNHNSKVVSLLTVVVVYLMISTSNHNSIREQTVLIKLYILWFLHQTTTSYMKSLAKEGCISYDFYIKPQLPESKFRAYEVVYLMISTSNHNIGAFSLDSAGLYILWFLHQTTTWDKRTAQVCKLYILWFLHQTTTCGTLRRKCLCCISYDFYIKPQLKWHCHHKLTVVYLMISTSNHNPRSGNTHRAKVVYLMISTSNHNKDGHSTWPQKVVYLMISTSNHNHGEGYGYEGFVVYLMISTSNHNWRNVQIKTQRLYILWFLHQTTTTCAAAMRPT